MFIKLFPVSHLQGRISSATQAKAIGFKLLLQMISRYASSDAASLFLFPVWLFLELKGEKTLSLIQVVIFFDFLTL